MAKKKDTTIPQKYLENILTFAFLCKVFLYKYQIDWSIRLENNFKSIILACRRAGKSFGITFWLVYMGYKYPGIKINIFAPAVSQSKRILAYIREIITNTPILYANIDRKSGRGIANTYIQLANCTRYEIFGEKSKIDSADSDIILVDETGDMNREIINERIMPTLTAKNRTFGRGRIIFTGVPKYENDPLFDLIFKNKNSEEILPIINAEIAVEQDALDLETLKMLKDNLTEEEYARAFQCIWSHDANTVFSNQRLSLCYSEKYVLSDEVGWFLKPGRYILGFDASGRGKSGISKWALVIHRLEENTAKLVYYKTWGALYPTDKLEKEIIEIWRNIRGAKYMLVDKFGEIFTFNLQRELFKKQDDKSLLIQPFDFTTTSKHNIYHNAVLKMEKAECLLPLEDDESFELYTHLRNMKKTETAKLPLYDRKNTKVSDDLADAYCLSLYCIEFFNLFFKTLYRPASTVFNKKRLI